MAKIFMQQIEHLPVYGLEGFCCNHDLNAGSSSQTRQNTRLRFFFWTAGTVFSLLAAETAKVLSLPIHKILNFIHTVFNSMISDTLVMY